MKHKTNFFTKFFGMKVIIGLFTLSVILFSCKPENGGGSDYGPIEPPVNFTPDIPVDVDPAVQAALKAEGDIYALNQEFNLYSWQAFVAIQWPRDADGTPMPNFTDEGEATWLGWKEAFQVYRADGQKPAPWGSPRTPSGLGLDDAHLNDTDARIVLSSFTPTGKDPNIVDEVDQAFAGKLFDQNGNLVVYEVLMNEAEFNYVVDSTLYNINGQLEFAKHNTVTNFPKGNYEDNTVGAVEIKFAWKILEDADHKERYYRDEGYVINDDGTYTKKDIGMIGFHISQKTPTGKQWVWSTFEHIDNLDQNVIVKDGSETIIHPTLRDPDCEICPANLDLTTAHSYTYEPGPHGPYWLVTNIVTDPKTKKKDTVRSKYYTNSDTPKTQAKRMVNIPVRVQQINEMMQEYFEQQNSVWQYYMLVDTQYPLNQNVAAAPHQRSDYQVPESVVNKPGGDPNIALLTNITMETFFQLGNQDATNLMEGNLIVDGVQPTTMTIYGTESCMGCHSSAGFATQYFQANDSLVQGGQLSGDFSWLLSQKAHWNDSIPKPTQPSN